MTPPLTLALDASTYAGTAALIGGLTVLGEAEVAMRTAGREALLPAVAELMRTAGHGMTDVGRIVCGSGPGSFTSLRIAASIAKALAFRSATGGTAHIPFYGVSSLTLIVAGNDVACQPGRYVAVLDALRGDVYAAVLEVDEHLEIAEIEGTSVRRRDSIESLAARHGARIVGPDQALRLSPHARGVARLGATLQAATPADLAAWEPDYGRPAAAQQRWEESHGRTLSGA